MRLRYLSSTLVAAQLLTTFNSSAAKANKIDADAIPAQSQISQHAQQPSASHRDDTYEIYSTVLPGAIWDHVDKDPLLLIAEDANSTSGSMEPDKCIEAPPEYRSQMTELLADYEKRKAEKVKLQPHFQMKRPYRLLTKDECDQFVRFRFNQTPPNKELAQLFAKTPDLIRLSPVFFSRDHTVAMVLVSNYCGSLCGGVRWHNLVKRKGVWVGQLWSDCQVIF